MWQILHRYSHPANQGNLTLVQISMQLFSGSGSGKVDLGEPDSTGSGSGDGAISSRTSICGDSAMGSPDDESTGSSAGCASVFIILVCFGVASGTGVWSSRSSFLMWRCETCAAIWISEIFLTRGTIMKLA